MTVSARVAAPPDQVFSYVSDTRNDPEWCPNVDTVEMMEGERIAVGTRFRFHQHLDRPRGGRLEFDAELEITGLEDRSITWLATDRYQQRVIELTVAPEGDDSRVTQVTQATFLRPPGLSRWLYPFLARRTIRDQFRHLAQHFEG